MSILSEYISVKQMAEKLNISLDTAYKMSRTEGFPAYRIERSIRISVEKLEKWLEKRRSICQI